MLNTFHTIVIGAGITGIACAQNLQQGGVSSLLLDKGRGIGGRIATRRVSLRDTDICFDHGAQYFSPHDAAFREALALAGAVSWNDADARDRFVGLLGNSAIPRVLAQGLEIRQQVEVTCVRREADQWTLESTDGDFSARNLVLTIPAPQALRLLGEIDPLAEALQTVEMNPCLTLMAAFPKSSRRPFISRHDSTHPLAWISQDSSKPGRDPDFITWVAQAGPEFSASFIEESPEAIVERMLPLLCETIGVSPEHALHAQAHRWRYAQAGKPLGRPFLQDTTRSLYVGGDWCLGARAEDGWLSGQAMAHSILKGENVQ